MEEDVISQSIPEEDYTTLGNSGRSSSSNQMKSISGVSSKANVYDSSMQMFVFIKNSIKRCTTLTTGNTFLALSNEFKVSLKKYGDSLKGKCVAAIKANNELTISYLVNTAEYCSDVIPRLESMVKTKIKAEFSDKVDYTSEVDFFMDLVVDCIKALVTVLMDRLETVFKAIGSTNWAQLTQVIPNLLISFNLYHISF